MKLAIAVACLILPIAAHAGVAMECKTPEYAQLKDSSKGELLTLYCSAARHDKFNADAVAELHAGIPQKIRSGENVAHLLVMAGEYTDARKACQASATAAWGMLEKKDKKYRAQEPSCK